MLGKCGTRFFFDWETDTIKALLCTYTSCKATEISWAIPGRRLSSRSATKTAEIQDLFEASLVPDTISFTLPFTPDVTPGFRAPLTKTEHLMESAALNKGTLCLRHWEAGRERELRKPS